MLGVYIICISDSSPWTLVTFTLKGPFMMSVVPSGRVKVSVPVGQMDVFPSYAGSSISRLGLGRQVMAVGEFSPMNGRK